MAADLFAEFEPVTPEQWLEAVRMSLRGRPLDSLVKRSIDGIDMHPLTGAADLAGIAHQRSLPGQYPYVRGTDPAGYRATPWLIAQDIDFADPREFNLALRDALANGQSAIVLGDALQLAEPADVKRAFADIDLGRYPIFFQSTRSSARAADIYDLLLTALGEDEMQSLRGCAGCDPLGRLAQSGSIPADAFERLTAHVTNVSEHSPILGSIAVDTAAYHDAGANAVKELAIALATGVTYLRELGERGLDPDTVAGKTQIYLAIGENFFTEIAKFRAIKLLWAQMTRAFGVKGDGQKVSLHARSGCRNKTRRDPHVNLLRLTTEALSAALGGVDALTIAPFDQPLGTSDAFARRLARNLQLILQEELQLTQLIDPAGGTWHIEKLTDQLARSAWALFQEIEARGGMLACLQAGNLQAEIEAVADRRRRDVAAGETILVGSNKFANRDEPLPVVQPGTQQAIDDAAGDDMTSVEPLKPLRLAEPFESPPPGKGVDA